MRPLSLVIRVCATLLIGLTASSCSRGEAERPVVVVERGALVVPTAPRASAPEAAPRPATRGVPPAARANPVPAGPARRPVWSGGADRWLIERSAVPFLPPVEPPRNAPRRAPAPARATTAPTAAPREAPATRRALEPAVACADCGAKGEHSITRNGVSVWFCSAHFNAPDAPVSPGASLPEAPAAGRPEHPEPVATRTAASQCQGMTLRGNRCRRKTLDSSGLCFQHRKKE